MAHTLNLTKLEEGVAHATFHYFMKSDGASGELSAQTLVDPTTDFSPVLTPARAPRNLGKETERAFARPEIRYIQSNVR